MRTVGPFLSIVACASCTDRLQAAGGVTAPIASLSASRTEAPPPSAFAGAACVVTDGSGRLIRRLRLSLHGHPFAWLRNVEAVELRLVDDAGAVHVTTRDVELTGDVLSDDLAVRPRNTRPHDGWLQIKRLTPQAVHGPDLVATPKVSSLVQSADPLTLTFACLALTLLVQHADDRTVRHDNVPLRVGASSALRATPDGPEVARVHVPSTPGPHGIAQIGEGNDVSLLERGANRVRLSFDGPDAVALGWVDASVVVSSGLAGSGSVNGRIALPPKKRTQVVCPRAVPIFVREGDETRSVGFLRTSRPLTIVEDATDGETTELGVDLGVDPALGILGIPGGPAGVVPFIERAAMEGCTVSTLWIDPGQG